MLNKELNYSHWIITGAESSGKTSLGQYLRDRFNYFLLEEQARTYFEERGSYVYFRDDIYKITFHTLQAQWRNSTPGKIQIWDTDLLNLYIWESIKYEESLALRELWLESIRRLNPLYILCIPDLPWEQDPFREAPNKKMRHEIYRTHKQVLSDFGLPFVEVSGTGPARFENISQILTNL
jgi:nicotinamide riboside kinase